MKSYGQWAVNTAVNYLNFYEMMYGDRLPTKAGLCRVLEIGKTTLYTWCETHEAFGAIVEQMVLEKERQTINFGVIGVFNPAITKVLLAEDGYGDRSIIDQNINMSDLTDAQLQYLAKHGRLPSTD